MFVQINESEIINLDFVIKIQIFEATDIYLFFFEDKEKFIHRCADIKDAKAKLNYIFESKEKGKEFVTLSISS